MKLIPYPDRDLMMLDLADMLASELADCLRRNESAAFCVPGGTTPGPIFDVLSEQRLDWDRVVVMLNDERWVPETSDRSNAALVRARLLTGRAAAATFLPFWRAEMTPEEAAPGIAAAVRPHLPISVLLTGMGTDMHTASLFPGSAVLGEALESHAPAVLAVPADTAGEERITLTGPVLSGAMSKHIVITGAAKREAIETAQDLPPHLAPIRTVLGGATVHWAP
jgi:6-phosphogluconolactonase